MQIYKTFSIFPERLLVRNEKVKSPGSPTSCKKLIIFSALKTNKKAARSKSTEAKQATRLISNKTEIIKKKISVDSVVLLNFNLKSIFLLEMFF